MSNHQPHVYIETCSRSYYYYYYKKVRFFLLNMLGILVLQMYTKSFFYFLDCILGMPQPALALPKKKQEARGPLPLCKRTPAAQHLLSGFIDKQSVT